MNKIYCIANPDTNYVFHMLSVAKCGYDNAYGHAYRPIYPPEDLESIKLNEQLLTVCGGIHCGQLYNLLVCIPACGKISAKDYYTRLVLDVEEGTIDNKYALFADAIKLISCIMAKHYDRYIADFWEKDRCKIESYIPALLDRFHFLEFTERAEAVVGHSLPTDRFVATLVASVENGAEAIDISNEQDVFGIERSTEDAVYFIGHEFIIYLLLDALKSEKHCKCFETWAITEGLAEFYLKKIMGYSKFFAKQQKYLEFYEMCTASSTHTAVELYRMALEFDGLS